MSEINSFLKYYEILNLPVDSDFNSCKRAYKQSVKLWHPDKYIHDASSQQFAEEKLKEINIAYSKIINFNHKYNIMPGVQLLMHSSETKNKFDISSLYENLSTTKSNNKSYYYKYVSILVASLVLISIYQLFSLEPEVMRNSVLPIAENTTQNSILLELEHKYFTFGTSVTDLLKIQGEPDYRMSQTWYYGNSWVLIQHGAVLDWYQDKKFPLKTISENELTYRHNKPLPETFQKGDTKSDVQAIQGEPDRRSRNVWYYQISKVYFKNNKVSSWFNSPLDPLHVKE